MELMLKIRQATADAAERDGSTYAAHPGTDVIDTMIELGRPSRLKGAGFYDYDEDGKRTASGPAWPRRSRSPTSRSRSQDVKDRMLFVEALETAKCFEEGVLTSAAAANIGSIMGIGFPPNTGGAAQFMTGYEAATGEIGLAAFVARADELAEAYGDRFRPTAYLRELAAKGERFPA